MSGKYGKEGLGTLEVNVGIFTSNGTNALSNTASIKIKNDQETEIIQTLNSGNSRTFEYVFNKKMAQNKIPLRLDDFS